MIKLKTILNEIIKVSKQDANYIDLTQQNFCSACVNYINQHKCKIVDGYIADNGHCDYFSMQEVSMIPEMIVEDWWAELSDEGQAEYIEQHPDSDKAKNNSNDSDKVAAITATSKKAAQDFISKNKIDSVKLYKYLKSGNLKNKMDFISALSGKPGNKYQKLIISKFSIKE